MAVAITLRGGLTVARDFGFLGRAVAYGTRSAVDGDVHDAWTLPTGFESAFILGYGAHAWQMATVDSAYLSPVTNQAAQFQVGDENAAYRTNLPWLQWYRSLGLGAGTDVELGCHYEMKYPWLMRPREIFIFGAQELDSNAVPTVNLTVWVWLQRLDAQGVPAALQVPHGW